MSDPNTADERNEWARRLGGDIMTAAAIISTAIGLVGMAIIMAIKGLHP